MNDNEVSEYILFINNNSLNFEEFRKNDFNLKLCLREH